MPKIYKRGLIAGAFDVIHVGYILLIQWALEYCDEIIIAVHDNPTQKAEEPIFDLFTRKRIVRGLKGVSWVYHYHTEDELGELIQAYADVHITGSDHKDEGQHPYHDKPMLYHDRNHDWSATKYKEMIRNGFSEN